MTVVTRKICLMGDFGVGKTSLVNRYVRSTFSDKYLTTVGVKVDTREVVVDAEHTVKLVIWDIAGTDVATSIYRNYLRGAAGYLLVADGTRSYTLDNALTLRDSVTDMLGDLPNVGLLNKADLTGDWEVPGQRLEELRAGGSNWLLTSAMSGENVEQAFLDLATALI